MAIKLNVKNVVNIVSNNKYYGKMKINCLECLLQL